MFKRKLPMCISYNDVLKRLIEEKKMSNKADVKEKKTVCDLNVMLDIYMELTNIQTFCMQPMNRRRPLQGSSRKATKERLRMKLRFF